MKKLSIIAIFVVAVASLSSCSEEAPPVSQFQGIKKKIGGQQPKAKINPEASRQAEVSTTDSASKGKRKPDIQPDNQSDSNKLATKLVKESMEFAGGYNPKGRVDPFEPLFRNQTAQVLPTKSNRKRRIPQTPLERVAISQLKLSAIMRTMKGNSAIVEDATGKGYVIQRGTYIGLNSGQVTQIEKDRVMIEEESEDISGEFRIRNTELKLQKPAGEL